MESVSYSIVPGGACRERPKWRVRRVCQTQVECVESVPKGIAPDGVCGECAQRVLSKMGCAESVPKCVAPDGCMENVPRVLCQIGYLETGGVCGEYAKE